MENMLLFVHQTEQQGPSCYWCSKYLVENVSMKRRMWWMLAGTIKPRLSGDQLQWLVLHLSDPVCSTTTSSLPPPSPPTTPPSNHHHCIVINKNQRHHHYRHNNQNPHQQYHKITNLIIIIHTIISIINQSHDWCHNSPHSSSPWTIRTKLNGTDCPFSFPDPEGWASTLLWLWL